MSHNITVILAKASWCPHCVDFTPIYKLAKEKIKPKDIDNCQINFVSFELDKNGEKERFQQEYPGLIDFLEGYPTVYFQMTEKNGNSRPKTEFISHTTAKQGGVEQAVQEFVKNIINKYKSIKSDNKVEYTTVQKGGQYRKMASNMTSMEEVEYRNKYLKYKSKYLELKNN